MGEAATARAACRRKAAARIDRGNHRAPEARGQTNRGSRGKMDDTEGKAGKEGDWDKEVPAKGRARLQVLPCALQLQVHCGKHKDILIKTETCFFYHNLTT